MIKEFLNKYNSNGKFTFRSDESLSQKCNAPKNAGGVYIVTDTKNDSIIYIGSSGWICQNGDFKIRKNGIFDRIVNGKQFDYPRRIAWPNKMDELNISEIKIEWYNTFNTEIKHIPAYVEACCIQMFFEKYNCLPIWNTDF